MKFLMTSDQGVQDFREIRRNHRNRTGRAVDPGRNQTSKIQLAEVLQMPADGGDLTAYAARIVKISDNESAPVRKIETVRIAGGRMALVPLNGKLIAVSTNLQLDVQLTGALSAATNTLTGESTATANVLSRNSSGDLEVLQYDGADVEINVIQRSTSADVVSSGFFGVVDLRSDEWRWRNGGGAGFCPQVSTEIYDLVTMNGQPGSGKRKWLDACNGGIPLTCRAYFNGTSDAAEPGGTGVYLTKNRNEGYIQWEPSAIPEGTFDVARDLWLKDVGSDIKVYDSGGSDVTGSATGISGEISESPEGLLTLSMAATYSGATKNAVLNWQIDRSTVSITRPPLTKARTFTQLVNFDDNTEVGSLQLCTQPVQYTLPTGVVTFEMVPAITARTDSDDYVTVSYTFTLRIVNGTGNDVTVHYDPDDMIGGHWLAWLNNVGFSEFATATTYAVAAGATNNKVVLTRTNKVLYWGFNSPMPDAVTISVGGEQFVIDDVTAIQDDSGYFYGRFTLFRGGDVTYG